MPYKRTKRSAVVHSPSSLEETEGLLETVLPRTSQQQESQTNPGIPLETPYLSDEEKAALDSKKTKVQRIQTSFSDEEKDEIIEFLKLNPTLYEKRRADYKNVFLKEEIWNGQAIKMGTTVKQLQTYHNSMRTKLGKLKQLSKNSG